ncbi:MAG: hypothetical protein U0324_14355 [Polyangiales bacterium]
MAEIPVERDRRGAFPWWIWLLAAALLGGTVALIVWNLNRPAEQRVVVREGQLLDVQGDFRRVPAGAAEAMRDQRAYLHVTVVRGSAVR